MNRFFGYLLILTFVQSLVIVWSGFAVGQTSVAPGINDKFRKPKVRQFKKSFETESREIFAQREEIVRQSGLKEGDTVADVGAGTGFFSLLFAKVVGDKGRVYAVEISANFKKHIERQAKRAKLGQISTILCGEKDSGLPEASCDLIFVCDTYHHFEYPEPYLKSLHKALKSDGRLVVIDFDRVEGKSSEFVLKHVRASKAVFIDELKAAGFQVLAEKDFLKENFYLILKKSKTT